MLARIRDWHQNLSWNVGHRQGQAKRPFKCPWWADRQIFGLAYMQGMTGEQLITEEMVAQQEESAASLRDFLDSRPRPKRSGGFSLVKLSNETIRENIIGVALMMPHGKRHFDLARDYLTRMAARGRFNTERAIEVMTIMVDNAVWADVSRQENGRLLYREYKASGLGPIVGKELADRLIAEIGATDQRPARQWLRFLLGA